MTARTCDTPRAQSFETRDCISGGPAEAVEAAGVPFQSPARARYQSGLPSRTPKEFCWGERGALMPPTVLTSKKTTAASETLQGLRVACQVDLYALAKRVLYAHLTPNLLTDGLHRPLCEAVQGTPYEENLYLLSRGMFKSSLITVANVIQRLLADPEAWWCQQRWRGRTCGANTRVLIASNKGRTRKIS